MKNASESLRGMHAQAARVMHVSRRWDFSRSYPSGVMARKCADCRCTVAVTKKVYDERFRTVSDEGRVLEILCDECALTYAGEVGGPVIAVMPTSDEIQELGEE